MITGNVSFKGEIKTAQGTKKTSDDNDRQMMFATAAVINNLRPHHFSEISKKDDVVTIKGTIGETSALGQLFQLVKDLVDNDKSLPGYGDKFEMQIEPNTVKMTYGDDKLSWKVEKNEQNEVGIFDKGPIGLIQEVVGSIRNKFRV